MKILKKIKAEISKGQEEMKSRQEGLEASFQEHQVPKLYAKCDNIDRNMENTMK